MGKEDQKKKKNKKKKKKKTEIGLKLAKRRGVRPPKLFLYQKCGNSINISSSSSVTMVRACCAAMSPPPPGPEAVT
jgi:hypothetical protein